MISYYILILVGVLIGIIRFKNLTRSSVLLLLLLVITLIVEFFAVELGNWFNNYYLVYSIFQPIEYALITLAYYETLQKRYFLYSIGVYIVIAVFNTFFWQTNVFGTNMLTLTMLLTSVWALVYLQRILAVPSNLLFTHYDLFWSSIGFLLFNTSCLFVYGAYNFIGNSHSQEINAVFSAIRITANHLLYLLIAMSLVGKQRKLQPV